MPAQGRSANVGRPWTLDECVPMLLAVRHALGIGRCVAVGHSWGAMTLLRAAVAVPHRFAALALVNMQFQRTGALGRLGFTLQKPFPNSQRFFVTQAARGLYTPAFLSAHPLYAREMTKRLALRPPKEIGRIIDAV